MERFFGPDELQYIIRLLVASVLGALIGLEREKRAKNAGLRTHIIVAISSALMMIVSKYGFNDILGIDGIGIDASRIAAGVVTAIGFLGGGVIFVRKENTIGVTTAAGLWATVGMGIAVGAGMYAVGVIFTALILMFQCLLHMRRFHTNFQMVGTIKVLLNDQDRTMASIEKTMRKEGLSVRNMTVKKTEEGMMLIARIVFNKDVPLNDVTGKLGKIGELSEIDISSVS